MIEQNHKVSFYQKWHRRCAEFGLLGFAAFDKGDTHNVMSLIASRRALDCAYRWYQCCRRDASPHNGFWSLSRQWDRIRDDCRVRLQAGEYTLSPLTQYALADGSYVSQWDPLDAIVLKAMALVLTPLLTSHYDLSSATHLKGGGGVKGAVRQAQRSALSRSFVFKTDIADYYASISHHKLHAQLCDAIADTRVQRLLWQVMNRVHVKGGSHRLIENKSIPRGCPLSPLFGALYLLPLDQLARDAKVSYGRYMDDFVIMCDKRHQLKKMIKRVYATCKIIGLKLAPEKTWVGRVEKGFDFLGYRISPKGLSIALVSWNRFTVKLHRLLEQGATPSRWRQYIQHWIRWATSGVSCDREALLLNIKHIFNSRFHFNGFVWPD